MSSKYYKFVKKTNYEYNITNEKWARQKLLSLEALKHEIN